MPLVGSYLIFIGSYLTSYLIFELSALAWTLEYADSVCWW